MERVVYDDGHRMELGIATVDDCEGGERSGWSCTCGSSASRALNTVSVPCAGQRVKKPVRIGKGRGVRVAYLWSWPKGQGTRA
jgi:hypothetical protein